MVSFVRQRPSRLSLQSAIRYCRHPLGHISLSFFQTPATVEFAFGDNPNYTRSILKVPKSMVGLVIGKGGETIKRIGADTGAKVQFDQGMGGWLFVSVVRPSWLSLWIAVHLHSDHDWKKKN
jgi:hypothetical protein